MEVVSQSEECIPEMDITSALELSSSLLTWKVLLRTWISMGAKFHYNLIAHERLRPTEKGPCQNSSVDLTLRLTLSLHLKFIFFTKKIFQNSDRNDRQRKFRRVGCPSPWFKFFQTDKKKTPLGDHCPMDSLRPAYMYFSFSGVFEILEIWFRCFSWWFRHRFQ